jgi:hypothetical protein
LKLPLWWLLEPVPGLHRGQQGLQCVDQIAGDDQILAKPVISWGIQYMEIQSNLKIYW